MHIDYKKAPMIGDVKKLVEQTLDPMVSAFFKNIAQKMTLIELLQNRAAIQEESGNEMKARFEAYSLELQEVLIGTPRAVAGDRTIEDILFQLRSRQVAREQVTTFQEQEKAAVQERTLNEAKATAAAQIALTQSLIQVKVHEGAAALAQKDAETVKVTAAAAGERSRLEGKGEADRTLAIGTANAQATKLSVDAYGGPRISFGRTKLLALRRRLDQDQSAACAAISNVRRAGRGELRRPHSDSHAELDVRPHDARRLGEIEGRGAKDHSRGNGP
jgi:uncharacterized membrane protein YqiK